MRWNESFSIGGRVIAADQPTYFIADLASSHDGDLERAKALIWKAKVAGADCAKFQHFLAKDIVSDAGFKALGSQSAHQAGWKKSVYEVFEQYQTPRDWTEILVEECARAGIDYMTTPYDRAAVDLMDGQLDAFKIGSGDVTWTDFIAYVAAKGKPLFLAVGASDMADVERAVEAALIAGNRQLCLMQCNTNYTGDLKNFGYVNLNVLKGFAARWPGMPLGLSDHTPGHAAVLGAITLGARAVEKHFTDDNDRDGPDHAFSMNPRSWRDMVDRARELEAALGDGVKRVEPNEEQSAIVQRRALRFRRAMAAGETIRPDDLEALRPCPAGALEPWMAKKAIGRTLSQAVARGDAVTADLFETVSC
jgi:N-acetylneuraminate synthase